MFSFPKSLHAVKDVIDIFTEEGGDDIILDFFAGSGTSAHAVLELNREDGGNRQFILCEQMDYVEDVTSERVKRVIENTNHGAFVYCELLQWNERYVQRIRAAMSTGELWNVWEEMQAHAFLSYRVDIDAINSHAGEFAALTLDGQRRFLLETLDRNALYVNLSEMDDETYGVSDEDKRLNRLFYGA